ncbi:MAG: hypothetical protein WCP97_01225 [bacterium]
MPYEKKQPTFPPFFEFYIVTLLTSLVGAFIGKLLFDSCQARGSFNLSCVAEFLNYLSVGQAIGYIIGASMIFFVYSFKPQKSYSFLPIFIADFYFASLILFFASSLGFYA